MPGPVQPVPQGGDPVPGGERPGEPGPDGLIPGSEPAVSVLPGLSWSWELDFETLQRVLSEPAPWNRPARRPAASPAAEGADTEAASDAQAPSDGQAADSDVSAERPAALESEATPAGEAGPDSQAAVAGAIGQAVAASEAGTSGPAAGNAAAASPANREDPDAELAASTHPDGTSSDGVPAAGTDSAGEHANGEHAAGTDSVGEQAAGEPDAVADEQEAIHEALLDAIADGRAREVPIAVVAGRVAEALPPGPDLAGWLAITPAREAESGALPGVAASFRRLAAWAQAGELAAIAEMASRSAAADDKAGVAADGRPVQVPDEAEAQVSLALAMTRNGAAWWTGLAVRLAWALPATGAALAAGDIDLARARIIAEATAPLDDDTARVVEDSVLPGAGTGTTSQLRAAARRAVIAADPAGADERRKDAERNARIRLYADDDGTATLTGQNLPGTRAAAALARITALARAMKAAGSDGGMDLLRAQVYIGLLLGTLPVIPPPPDAPPDHPPPDEDDGDGDGDGDGPGDNGDASPGRQPCTRPRGPQPDGPPRRQPSPGRPPRRDQADPGRADNPGVDDSHSADDSPAAGAAEGKSGNPAPDSGPGPAAGADDSPGAGTDDSQNASPAPANSSNPDPRPGTGPQADNSGAAGNGGAVGEPRAGPPPGPPDNLPGPPHDLPGPPGDDIPPPGDADAPADEHCGDPLGGDPAWAQPDPFRDRDEDDGWTTGPLIIPTPTWASMPGLILPPGTRPPPGPGTSRPLPGLLDLTLPWTTLAGTSPDPGYLGRLGPITPAQAREIADAATADPAVQWRIILTSPAGHATAVTRIPVPRTAHALPGDADAGLVGRVTLTIPDDILTTPPPTTGEPGDILTRALRAAGRAATAAAARAAADAAAAAGCAHATATTTYRPPPRLRDYVVARDLTCRFPSCRQPAWRGDLDHTHPWDQGGLTCSCNLGGLCRYHHVLKQHPDWNLTQIRPGIFQWTTPTGRTYTTTPDCHAA